MDWAGQNVNKPSLEPLMFQCFDLCFMVKYSSNFQGKVPRNEYGNVELFKPSMLPGGTVHLPSKSLNIAGIKL